MLEFAFMGGPAVFQNGLELCRKEGVRIPFDEAQIRRLRWTLPAAFYALAMTAMEDYRRDTRLVQLCSREFAFWMASHDNIRGKIGDYLVLPSELEELRRSGKVHPRADAELREIVVSEGELARVVSAFRLRAIMPLLARERRAASNSDGTIFGKVKGFFASKPPEGLAQFASISALATCVTLLVTAEDPEKDLLRQIFIIDVLGEAHKLTARHFQTYFEAPQ